MENETEIMYVKLHNFIIFRWLKDKLGLQLRPRLQKANCLSQKNVSL